MPWMSPRLAAAVLIALTLGCAPIEQSTPTPASPLATPPVLTPAPTHTPAGTPADQPTPAGTPEPQPGRQPPAIAFETIGSGFQALTFLTGANDGSGRVYVVEQRGVVHVGDEDGNFAGAPFLDIRDRVSAGGERGLLGLAFHPDYAANGRLFVNYTGRNGNTVVAQYLRPSPEAPTADPDSERVLLQIEQPFSNHNGGMIAFGPDGTLYISTGDGGGGGDPLGNGQDRATMLGAILRIDVDAAVDALYAIPADNPLVGDAAARGEIWSYGLRNPWRFSFDRARGDMFIADVGSSSWEEVNAELAGQGGRNYGWNIMEGPECFRAEECDRTGLTPPVAWYPTRAGCAITGGYVYRGTSIPALAGFYLYADYCSGDVWALDAASALAGNETEAYDMGNAGIMVTSFGEDERGELYLVGSGGEVLRVMAGD